MGQACFSEPVFLKLYRNSGFRAGSPAEALQYLEQHWQSGHTPHYRQAKVLCRAASDGIVSVETARVALVDAAQRCGVLADGRLVDGMDTDGTLGTPQDTWRTVEAVDEITDSDLVGYYSAADVLNDPALSPSRRRALIAYWASDLHAVVGAPALRSVRGVTVTIDSLFEALCQLDAEVDVAAMASTQNPQGRSW